MPNALPPRSIVLVHGAWAGAWAWDDVAPDLRDLGFDAHAPWLSGLGPAVALEGAAIPAAAVTLTTHARDIAGAIEYRDLHDVTLVGHSYGGAVITQTAEYVADRLARLIYIDAMVLGDGECAFDVYPETARQYLRDTAIDGMMPVVPPDDPAYAARMTPQSVATFEEPVHLADPRAAALPRAFIHCTQSSFRKLHLRRISGEPNWDIRMLESGHFPMRERPHDLAALIAAIASGG